MFCYWFWGYNQVDANMVKEKSMLKNIFGDGRLVKKMALAGFLVTALCCGNNLCAQKAESLIDESLEPQDSYSLEIDGKDFPVFLDHQTELKLEKNNPQVRLKVSPFKIFNYGTMYLAYPRHFTFEAELSDKDVKLWNLSGNNTILMLQKYKEEIDHVIMGNMLQQRFGEQNASLSECEMTFMGSKKKGTRVFTTIGDSSIAQEVYSFKIAEGSILLIIQDSINAQGKGSTEGTSFREQISKTFKIPAQG